MTLKTPAEWAEIAIAGSGEYADLVIDVRNEFAAAAAEEFQKLFGVKTASEAHNTAILACCFAVERLAKSAPEEWQPNRAYTQGELVSPTCEHEPLEIEK